MDSNEKKVFIA